MGWAVLVDSVTVLSTVPMEQLELAVDQCTLGSLASQQEACSWENKEHHNVGRDILHSDMGTVERTRSFACGPWAYSCMVGKCLAVGYSVAVQVLPLLGLLQVMRMGGHRRIVVAAKQLAAAAV